MLDPARFFWLGGAKAAVLCGALASASVHAADAQRRAGDLLATALPVGVVAHEAWRRDGQGLWQFGLSYGVTLGAGEVLKRTTHSQRPDRSNDLSFPSGHASQAFASATYMHRRHGLDSAWPWYIGAGYVSWTRVHSRRHRWGDVAGSALIAATSSWLLVDPYAPPNGVVLGSLGRGSVALELHATW
jgi:membrane-associated phospholipid phosphatase